VLVHIGPTILPPGVVAQSAQLTGMSARHPALTVRLVAPDASPKIEQIKVALPHGLSVRSDGATLRKGVSVNRKMPLRVTTRKRAMTITLRHPVADATVRIASSVLVESLREAAAIRSHHGTAVVKVTIEVSTGSNQAVRLVFHPRLH
jgi:hypothetical protein